MDVLTDQQLKEISDIISQHIGVMVYVATGQGIPDPNLLKILGIPQHASGMIQNAFVLGKVMKLLEDNDLKKLTYDQLKEKAKEYSLTQVEKNSLKFAEANAGRYITALGRRVTDSLDHQISRASYDTSLELAQRKLINDKIQQAIIQGQTRSQLASELGHSLKDWKRDWQRISHTEIWNAKLQGEVVTIIQGEAIYAGGKGADSNVYRRPHAEACSHCKRLYLEADGVTPKVFKLSELIDNGTNVGKKVAEWKPITGTTHPNCSCPIAVLPEGFGFVNGELEFIG